MKLFILIYLIRYFVKSTPVDITVYDIRGIPLTAEHSDPVVVKTVIAHKGKPLIISDRIHDAGLVIVNTSLAGNGQLKAELIQPSTPTIPCQCHIHELDNEEYLIQYIPNESGRYQLRLLFNNQLVQGKTMDTNVYSLLPPPFLFSLSSVPLVHV